jgi:hypothetical protein
MYGKKDRQWNRIRYKSRRRRAPNNFRTSRAHRLHVRNRAGAEMRQGVGGNATDPPRNDHKICPTASQFGQAAASKIEKFLPLLSGIIAFSKTGGHQWPTTNIAGIIVSHTVSHARGVERWRSLL